MKADSRKHRRWAWILVPALMLLAGAAWLGLGLRSAATDVKGHAVLAQDALRAAQVAVSAGDYAGAQKAVSTARSEVSSARTAAAEAPVRLAGHMPVAGQAVADLDAMISAAELVTDATGRIVDVYGGVTGKTAGSKPVLVAGGVDLVRLKGLGSELAEVDRLLGEAEQHLRAVEATLPGTGSLAAARDAALADVVPVRATISRASALLPLLPDALGAKSPTRYLVAIMNQGELRASGGAPLSVALMTFDKGRFSFGGGGAVSQLRWPGDGFLVWKGSYGSPWNSPTGMRRARFANANFHPDFRSAGFDIRSAWEAGAFPGVQGVLGIDLTAIANVLRHTGPIPDSPFGPLTAENLGQKLLIDSYREFGSDPAARQAANNLLVKAILTRLTSGSSLLSMLRALGESAPGRHVQVFDSSPKLAAQLAELGLDGAVDVPQGSDAVAFFSQNVNGSKVDVFQTRKIQVTATVAADGSATVTQAVTVRNAIPKSVPVTTEKTGYTSPWSRSAFFFYQPSGATDVALTVPGDFETDQWRGGAAWTDDGYQRQLTQVTGWIAPRGTAVLSLSYRLPAGTFGSQASGLAYRFVANPQPTWHAASLAVTVTGPSGTAVTGAYTLDSPVTASLSVS